MKKLSFVARASMVAAAASLLMPLAATAQNITTVNGKPVPKARAEALLKQAKRSGQPVSPDIERQVRDEVVLREIFMQEAEKRRLGTTQDYKDQMELARQSILIRALFKDEEEKRPVTDAEIKAEYEKAKNESMGNQFKASHILVEKEEEAKALIAQIKGGAKFEELAKQKSKDTGSAAKGGDLDWARPADYVPEFSQAMVKLKKGEMTETPVKSPFGYHIIRLDDQKAVEIPALDEVKDQLKQELTQRRLAKFRDDLKTKAKTDYRFTSQ
jgi:peptidyl-prolyl cis-trans isomerase C